MDLLRREGTYGVDLVAGGDDCGLEVLELERSSSQLEAEARWQLVVLGQLACLVSTSRREVIVQRGEELVVDDGAGDAVWKEDCDLAAHGLVGDFAPGRASVAGAGAGDVFLFAVVAIAVAAIVA